MPYDLRNDHVLSSNICSHIRDNLNTIECILCLIPQDLLTRHKIMCADFLEKNYDRVSLSMFRSIIFGLSRKNKTASAELNEPPLICKQIFTEYEKLLHSENYVTKRQSLKVDGSLFQVYVMLVKIYVQVTLCGLAYLHVLL